MITTHNEGSIITTFLDDQKNKSIIDYFQSLHIIKIIIFVSVDS